MKVYVTGMYPWTYHTDRCCVHVDDWCREAELAELPDYAKPCRDCGRDNLISRLLRASPDEV
ncbi:hypothetical protein [Salinigranum halophilum]|uniref:hypothetical protein n=1 Tax=Salinigranum halophilum TaxID=2565931 RepID=UPI0010A8571D|nr:hypothetical protein [Salinigranum halophilum]